MPLTPFEYLTEHSPKGWKYKVAGKLLKGCCPLHDERTPSFYIYPDGHWHCYGPCDTGGDGGEDGTVPLIKHLEFSHVDSPIGWAMAGDRYRYLSGLPPKWTGTKENKPVSEGSLPATKEQQSVMRVFEEWCHQRLWDLDPRHGGIRGRLYFEQERHVRLSEFRHTIEIGYAPPHASWSKEGAYLFSLLSEMMMEAVGEEWIQIAIDLQILKSDNKGIRLRIRDRIMFFCHDDQGNTVFFQGRKVELPGDLENDYPKSMNPTSIKKMPFWLPVRTRRVKGSTHIEGPISVLLLSLHGIFTVAWLGAPASYFQIQRFPSPYILLFDHDLLKLGKGGVLQRAGDEYAKSFAHICDKELHAPWIRIRPPFEEDGPDDWVIRDGFSPLSHQLEENNLFLPYTRSHSGLYLPQRALAQVS